MSGVELLLGMARNDIETVLQQYSPLPVNKVVTQRKADYITWKLV